jgi:hypothetical protein
MALALLLLSSANYYSQCTGIGSSLATSYTSNNGSRGAMFNITATNTITILCFDGNLYGGTTAKYEIYYKSGTYVGSETNAAAWTLAGSVNSLYVSANNVPTAIPITVNVVIPAGQTYGFYVTNTASGGLNYISSAVTNVTLASDANLTMVGGVGKAYPFSSTYSYRLFNGTVHYAVGNVLPVEMTSFHATPIDRNVKLTWSTETESNSDYFGIERSADTYTWEMIGKVSASGITSTMTDYSFMDENPLSGISYYRLYQTDKNGEKKYFDVVSVERYSVQQGELSVFPNPTTEVITLDGTEDDLGEVELFDLMGRNITNEVTFTDKNNTLTIDLSTLDQDVIIVHSGDRYSLVMKK